MLRSLAGITASPTGRRAELRWCCLGYNPCGGDVCDGIGQQCHVTTKGGARCRCEAPCPPVMKPVCGSDRRTYDSECHLRRHACRTESVISVAHQAACSTYRHTHTHTHTHSDMSVWFRQKRRGPVRETDAVIHRLTAIFILLDRFHFCPRLALMSSHCHLGLLSGCSRRFRSNVFVL